VLGLAEAYFAAFGEGADLLAGRRPTRAALGAYALIAGWMQTGRSNCVLIRAIVDGPVEARACEGDLDDWTSYFRQFLQLMPPGLAAAVRAAYPTLRDDVEG
jgi:hypothetical protein